MKHISKIILVIFILLFIDSVLTHFVFNKRMNDIPNLEKQILGLSDEKEKLKSENSKLVNNNSSLRNENYYLKSVKTIRVPEYNVIEYGNQELLDEIEELESERDELQYENEDLKSRVDDDY